MMTHYSKDNFQYKIEPWMFTNLGISASKVLIYAIIYAVSSKGELYIDNFESLALLSNSSISTVGRVLKEMTEDNLIIKDKISRNGKVVTGYRHNPDLVPKN